MHEHLKATPGRQSRSARDLLRQPRIRLGAVVALAVAAGLIAWAVIGNDNSSSPSSTSKPVSGPVGGGAGPVGLSVQGLGVLSKTLHQPIFWAGPKPGYTYELTRTRGGNVYVRYLPQGVEVGDKRANFLIIVTYPFKGSFQALKRVSGGRAIDVPGGGIALVDQSYPKSVHMAFRGVNYQVEVYDPSPKRALQVALSGDVAPVR